MPKIRVLDTYSEDALNIIAKFLYAAYVYRKSFNKGPRIEPADNLDWAANYAYMLGIDDPNGEFSKLMRLYLTLHCDHEGGNVSSFSAATINPDCLICITLFQVD
jgi:citrate synthase